MSANGSVVGCSEVGGKRGSSVKFDILPPPPPSSSLVQEMKYDDGDSPPRDVIDRWLAVVDEVFLKRKQPPDQDLPAIAVHCVAGRRRRRRKRSDYAPFSCYDDGG